MAYRTTEARLDRDQALRARILDCALLRVAEGGFAALTMQALADDVGIATGSLYRHFRSKGELAAEVFASASQREVDALAAADIDRAGEAGCVARTRHAPRAGRAR